MTTTSFTGETCSLEYPWYWASTTHAQYNGSGAAGVYVCFGRSTGYMSGWVDVHGAGSQRSDPKSGSLSSYSYAACGYYNSIAPQGDSFRISNYVRLVRGGAGPLRAGFRYAPSSPTDATPVSFGASGSGGTAPYAYAWGLVGTPASGYQVLRREGNGGYAQLNDYVLNPTLRFLDSGKADYDALQVHLEKRFSHDHSYRVGYTLAYSRGNTSGAGIQNSQFQRLDDMRLDLNEGPTNFDRRHNLVISGMMKVPRTGGLTVSGVGRWLSGLPFTLIDANDLDRNGILFDPLPAGTYSGSGDDAYTTDFDGRRAGARGPGFFQVDLRLGYRIGLGGDKLLDLFGDIVNITNRANFLLF